MWKNWQQIYGYYLELSRKLIQYLCRLLKIRLASTECIVPKLYPKKCSSKPCVQAWQVWKLLFACRHLWIPLRRTLLFQMNPNARKKHNFPDVHNHVIEIWIINTCWLRIDLILETCLRIKKMGIGSLGGCDTRDFNLQNQDAKSWEVNLLGV